MFRGRIVAVVLLACLGTANAAVAQCSNGKCGKTSGVVISAPAYQLDQGVMPLDYNYGYSLQGASIAQPLQAVPTVVQSIDPGWNATLVSPVQPSSIQPSQPSVNTLSVEQAPACEVAPEQSIEVLYDVPTDSIEYPTATGEGVTSTSSESLNTLNFVDHSFSRDTVKAAPPTVAVKPAVREDEDLFESPTDDLEEIVAQPVVELPAPSEVVDTKGQPLLVELTTEPVHQLAEVETELAETEEESPAICLLYTSPSPRDATLSRMPSSA